MSESNCVLWRECHNRQRLEIEGISRSTNMSVNLRNGMSESKLFGEERMSEGVSKYEKI